jgi:DNA polymerase
MPRSLDNAAAASLGIKMDKGIRSGMKGKQFDSLDREERKALAEYALLDAKASYQLWKKHGHLWPEWERQLSQETTRMCWEGLPVDADAMDKSITNLENSLCKALEILPWTEVQVGALSPKEWAAWCRGRGKEPPPSMAKDNPEVQAWMEENPDEGRVLEATHMLRGANSLLKKFRTMRERVRPDGRLSYGMKYFGAHTGRDSGDAGFNVQNFPRSGMYGADLRGCIRAGAGKILLVSDLAQIEARCVAWLAGEESMLDLARQGLDWYEAMARAFRLYNGESPMKAHAPDLRHTMKQMCLGCQYRMSATRFASMTGVEYDDAVSMVRMFRAKMPKLVKLWGKLERDMRLSAQEKDRLYEIELPSGRSMRYRDVQVEGGLSAVIPRTGKLSRIKFWSGMLMENATQAFARDLFMDRVLALREAGHKVVLRVHDEVVIEADQDNHKEAAEDIERIMSSNPEWCETMPMAAECDAMERYTK